MRVLLSAAALSVLFFPISQSRAADSLPSELSNDEFRAIVSELSESDVTARYTANNYVSNELYYQTVIPLVRARAKSGGVYVGVGPEQNFTYIAAFHPQIAFIIDIRRQNLLELLMYKALFELAPDRANFVSLLFSRKRPPEIIRDTSSAVDLLAPYHHVEPDGDLFRTTLEAIEDRLLKVHKLALSSDDIAGIRNLFTVFRDNGFGISINGASNGSGITFEQLMTARDRQGQADSGIENSFLASEDSYRFVRQLQLKNLIVPLVGDFGGPKAIRAVGAYVREREGIVSVFYMSNVTGYLDSSQRGKFFESVRTMPLDPASTFIRAAGPPALGAERVPPGRLNGYFTSIVPMLELLDEVRQGHIQFIPQDIDKISR